ncbi:MAG: putative glycoside hydrolase [Gammaproteobacteria bacterium]|nr:putative glycoside hydrolase [Gammaproteobacteria bacterium]
MRGIAIAIFMIALLIAGMIPAEAHAHVKGIYITQSTAEHTRKLQSLIKNAKEVGIDTFIIDINRPSKRYARNIKMVKDHGIRYVARVVVFPHGGLRHQVRNKKIWENRWRKAAYAIRVGADEIQLDYIRFKPRAARSKQNVVDIYKVIRYFREKLDGTGVKLQIDIFGVAAERPSYRIGQHVGYFARELNAICPMVYPSHYEPFRYHSQRPYQTVHKSVRLLKKQLKDHDHVRVYAYLEISNYRYPMSWQQRKRYIRAQIQGALDAGAHGYYIWSAKNKYRLLFQVLREYKYKPGKYQRASY